MGLLTLYSRAFCGDGDRADRDRGLLTMKPSRRKFFRTLGTGAAGMTIGHTVSRAATEKPGRGRAAKTDADAPTLLVGDNIAVADTHVAARSAATSCAASTTSSASPTAPTRPAPNRFMPPQKPKPWTDVCPALWWGNSRAAEHGQPLRATSTASFRDHWNYDDVSEDCLRLNVFTPALKDGKKRPVMFWIHGGGYTNGNGIEQDGYNGENLARFGDVVFVLDQPPARPARLLQPRRRRRREVRRLGQRRHARHRRRARVGARQHRQLRRRSRQRHDHGRSRAAARRSAC